MEPVSLSATQLVIRDGERFVARYQVELRAGGLLQVTVPDPLGKEAAGEVGAQLRELVHSIETPSTLTEDEERVTREHMVVSGERFDLASPEVPDLYAARRLIANYSGYVAAVLVYLRALSVYLGDRCPSHGQHPRIP